MNAGEDVNKVIRPTLVAIRYAGSVNRKMLMRVDGDLFDAAQQISHWARIGRELEASPVTSLRDIQRVLAGQSAYDDLGERGQAIVRAIWDEQMADRRGSLDLAAEFTQAGRSWSEADELDLSG